MEVQVVGVGSAVPDRLVTNEDLASLGYDADWIVQRTGILERRYAPPETATGDLAYEAARRCVADGGVDPRDIDLLILGTYTPDQLLPATACTVQDRLGVTAPAMDLQVACAGFVYAMVTGAQFIASGCNKLVLVIGADCNSRVINPRDRHTYPLFGDAAGAVLLAPGSPEQGLIAYAWGADGSGADLLCRRVGGSRYPFHEADSVDGLHFLKMEGRPVFKWAIRMLSESITGVLQTAGMTVEDLNLVILHQANMRIINSAIKDLGIDPAKVFNNLERYGNTSAASVPLALDEAYRQGRVRRGDCVLLSGFGAGLAWGTVLLRW
ncbi:MAG TPA: ketoacyl-ACP synthase III [Planctomycetes bacterium]|nr:ketoacyl-ACP synthase III [Planctomycetota bacterium]